MKLKQYLFATIFVFLMGLIGLPVWAGQETPQQKLDNALIEAVKAEDTAKALQALADGASGEARDSTETYLAPQEHDRPPNQKDVKVHLSALVLLYHQADQKATSENRGSGPDLALVRALLDHGAKVNDKDVDGSAPLLIASSFSNSDTVRLLLKRGANIEQADVDGSTPLMFVNDIEVAKALLEQHASLKAVNRYGLNALMCAVTRPNVVRLFLDHGADMEAVNNGKQTALIWAVESSALETVRILLEHGAKIGAKDRAGKTALTVAQERVRDNPTSDAQKIVALLRKHGAK